MTLEWSPALLIGNTQIDDQHKKIFEIVGRLRDAITARAGNEEVGRTLATVAVFVVSHFHMEESLMEQFAFEGAGRHRQAHESVRLQVEEMVDQFHAGNLLAEALADFLERWVEEHVQGEDLILAQFLASGEEATA